MFPFGYYSPHLYRASLKILDAYECDGVPYRFHGWAAARADLKNEENKRECVPSFLNKLGEVLVPL